MSIIEELRRNGLVKLEEYVDPLLFAGEFESCINGEASVEYSPGKMARVPRHKYNLIPKTYNYFNSKFFKDIMNEYLDKPNDFLLQIFMTHEFRTLPKEQWSRNLHLHFDPYRALKFMVYLTDVTKETGAFRYIPATQSVGKVLRERNSLEDNLRSNTYTLEAHPDHTSLVNEVVYIEGKAGTLLIFDTDCIHAGGVLERGERKTIVAHSR